MLDMDKKLYLLATKASISPHASIASIPEPQPHDIEILAIMNTRNLHFIHIYLFVIIEL